VMLAEGSKRDVQELVTAGLWSVTDGGYSVSGYLEHNKSKADMASAREKMGKGGAKGGGSNRLPNTTSQVQPTKQGTLLPTKQGLSKVRATEEEVEEEVDTTPSGVGKPPADAPESEPKSHPVGSLGAILRAAATPSPEPDSDAPCQLPEFTEATIRAVRKQVHDLYTAKVGYSHDLNGQHIQRLTQTLRGVSSARGEALPVVVERAVTGYLADPFWQAKRWPLNGLVSQAARFADPAKPEDIKIPDRSRSDAKVNSLRSKISAAETERRLAASMNPGALAKLDERLDGMRREMKRLEATA